jgi:hypothetical protein
MGRSGVCPQPSAAAPVARRVLLIGLLAMGSLGLFAASSSAALFQLTDDNSTVPFNTATSSNAFGWTVDGVSHLTQQAFWYRVGNAAEQSLHALPIAQEGTSDTDFDGNHDTLYVRYNGAGFVVEVAYRLDGGALGSGASDMSEQISITSTTDSPLDFHFFQYNDYDLQSTSAGDSARFTNANAVQQFEGLVKLAETVVTPVSSHREIAPFSTTLDKLTNATATTLSDTPATGVIVGPADLAWAFQWDVVIPAGDTFQISKDKNLDAGVIPEPATAAAAAALAALATRRRR